MFVRTRHRCPDMDAELATVEPLTVWPTMMFQHVHKGLPATTHFQWLEIDVVSILNIKILKLKTTSLQALVVDILLFSRNNIESWREYHQAHSKRGPGHHHAPCWEMWTNVLSVSRLTISELYLR